MPIELLPHKPSAVKLGWHTATFQVWLVNASSSSHGACGPPRALSFPSRRMFLVSSVTRRMFGPRVVVTIFWENYFKVDREPPVLCCCEELWWVPGSWGSLKVLMSSQGGRAWRKLVAAQDWAREVFQPPPTQAIWGLHFTPGRGNRWPILQAPVKHLAKALHWLFRVSWVRCPSDVQK